MSINKIQTIKVFAAIIGFGLGYAYWYFVGCSHGCAIQSVWWRMSLWGALMAYLTVAIFSDFLTNKTKK